MKKFNWISWCLSNYKTSR